MIELIEGELRSAGTPPAVVAHADSELQAVRDALLWARSGDLLLLPLHARRNEVLELLMGLEESGWRPGSPLPEAEGAR